MNGHKNGEPVREALLAFECEMQSLLVLVRFLVQLGQEFVLISSTCNFSEYLSLWIGEEGHLK